MSTPPRWGLLGTSFITGVMVDAIRQEGRSEAVAVAGRDITRLNDFASQYQIATTYTDFDALIADPNVDIVYIGLPNHVHTEYVIKAARAGKAVLCEKSLSVDLATTAEALAAVEAHGVFFAEGLMYLNHPLTSALLGQLESGAIGQLQSVQASYCAAISQFTNAGSQGALFNLGCYPVSLLHRVMQHQGLTESGAPQMAGFGRVGEDGNIVEANVALRFDNGLHVQLHTAEDYGLKHQFELLGSKGYLRCASNPWLPGTSNQLVVAEYEQPERIIEVPADGDAFLYQVRHIIDAIQAGEKQLPYPVAGWQDSAAIMALLCQWHDTVRG
ncbi:Gfo/Idh/MocA family oxidoreductase [Ferrimonas balearica]|uniref:Gfo/Idh/MocA family protein n=1 Tax=Ferrimonas balearica TaxID=44012 RepID=UPI001C58C5DB|nr:Gfo/Idh/MocA family oxidoreductase [Ferrimonas balearica]MBW3138875.1 Gfo/Idh/MocA family oxidoreductase [Ferrimonas balearica]